MIDLHFQCFHICRISLSGSSLWQLPYSTLLVTATAGLDVYPTLIPAVTNINTLPCGRSLWITSMCTGDGGIIRCMRASWILSLRDWGGCGTHRVKDHGGYGIWTFSGSPLSTIGRTWFLAWGVVVSRTERLFSR